MSYDLYQAVVDAVNYVNKNPAVLGVAFFVGGVAVLDGCFSLSKKIIDTWENRKGRLEDNL